MNGPKDEDCEETLQRCSKCGKTVPWVLLVPYKHQISGHHRVMLFDRETICKPLMKREYAFYKQVPENIARFVPELKGVAKASAKTDANGHDDLYAHPIQSDEWKLQIPCHCNEQRSFSNSSNDDDIACHWRYTPGQDEDKKEKIYDEHPWVKKVQKMSFEKNMYKTEDSMFILLETVGYRHRYPCIMDLKMGIQQYGDDATDIKIKDHQERCEKSTSSTLGVRLCGMQVYDPESRACYYVDKYTGRSLDTLGFKNCLVAFLNRGKRMDVVSQITDLLDQLYKGIQCLHTCRFFCSSLLLLYDADPGSLLDVEIRMIDFANVTLYSEKHAGPDNGYLFGITNLRTMFENIKCELEGGL